MYLEQKFMITEKKRNCFMNYIQVTNFKLFLNVLPSANNILQSLKLTFLSKAVVVANEK